MFLVFKSLLRRVALASGLLVLATNASIAQGTGAGEYGEGSVFDWNVFEVNDSATAADNYLHSTGDGETIWSCYRLLNVCPGVSNTDVEFSVTDSSGNAFSADFTETGVTIGIDVVSADITSWIMHTAIYESIGEIGTWAEQGPTFAGGGIFWPTAPTTVDAQFKDFQDASNTFGYNIGWTSDTALSLGQHSTTISFIGATVPPSAVPEVSATGSLAAIASLLALMAFLWERRRVSA